MPSTSICTYGTIPLIRVVLQFGHGAAQNWHPHCPVSEGFAAIAGGALHHLDRAGMLGGIENGTTHVWQAVPPLCGLTQSPPVLDTALFFLPRARS
jgi:hypothetical protein